MIPISLIFMTDFFCTSRVQPKPRQGYRQARRQAQTKLDPSSIRHAQSHHAPIILALQAVDWIRVDGKQEKPALLLMYGRSIDKSRVIDVFPFPFLPLPPSAAVLGGESEHNLPSLRVKYLPGSFSAFSNSRSLAGWPFQARKGS